MVALPFSKYEGLGNDFVVVDGMLPLEVRTRLSDRHRGVGGDGVLTVLPPTSDHAVATMHITNPDGSVPEMCGNGLRCVALALVERGVVRLGAPFVVDTGAGARGATVVDEHTVKVDMGPAIFDRPAQIPPWFRERIVVAEHTLVASTVSMGNPHVVIEIEPEEKLAAVIGKELEHSSPFPERTNVELAVVRDDGSVDVVVWERGVGLTQACGTGACGVAAVYARAGRVAYDADVVVRLPGGALVVRVPKDPAASVWMTGPARKVFRGVVDV